MPEPLLDVRALDAFYGDFQALFGVTLSVTPGERCRQIDAAQMHRRRHQVGS
jgi:ABC-type branched-subunit amino acid transport system ATPase component